MSELGRHLQELRERKGVSLADIARVTRIGRAQLAAIEAENFSELPAPIFVKGFIRSYCEALHESPDQALELYLRSRGEAARARSALPDDRFRGRRRRSPIAVAAVLLFLLAAVGLALHFVARRAPPPPEPAEAPSIAPARVSVAAVTELPAPPRPAPGGDTAAVGAAEPERAAGPPRAMEPPVVEPSVMEPPAGKLPARKPKVPPSVAASAGAASPAGHHLVARTTEPTWVRVQMDGGEVVQELLPAGVTREWTAERRFVLSIGNAGGIALELDGRPVAALGARRGVVRELVLPGGEIGKPGP